jgi:hypothetical protein
LTLCALDQRFTTSTSALLTSRKSREFAAWAAMGTDDEIAISRATLA